jgi:ABC-type multidrug transport system permease subunit
MSLPLAHFGHWWGSLIYASPVLVMAGALVFANWREKRRRRK